MGTIPPRLPGQVNTFRGNQMKYIAVKVNHKLYKKLVREEGGLIFHRVDDKGQYWVKAALNKGKLLMESYGLKAI